MSITLLLIANPNKDGFLFMACYFFLISSSNHRGTKKAMRGLIALLVGSAPAWYGSSLDSNPDIPQHKQK